MNLLTLDLNLLKVFEALLEERSVTRAGARIGLSQSSVSNALGRLRSVFADDLFVRTPAGMVPTPRAMRLEGPIRQSLTDLRSAMADPAPFDLASATGSIRISTSDLLEVQVAPVLLRVLQGFAPNVGLQLVRLDKRLVYRDLEADRVDLALSVAFEGSDDFATKPLMRDRFICIGRQGHPALEHGLTVERFVAYPHVLVSLKADSVGAVDKALARLGRSRRVAATVGHFLSVPDILAASDYLAAVPATSRAALTASGACQWTELPFDIPDWTVEMIWPERADSDPLQSWVRKQLFDLMANV